ncbi:MAG: HepT-like ribonuclease domain-containing protein [Cyclobacteriaceae bacterium]
MSKRDTLLLLDDMLQSALKIKRYSADYDYDSFAADEKTIDAIIRNFEIIGEAANRIDDDFRIHNPEIEWNRLRGFRNRIVHEYFGIDLEIVWNIIETYLITLIDWLETMIADLKGN